MRKSISRRALAFLLCTTLIATSIPAAAKAPGQVSSSALSKPKPATTCTGFFCGSLNIGPSGAQVAGAIIGVVAVGVVATVLVVHYKPAKVKGCLVSGPNGLELTSSDKAAYDLAGDTSSLKPGELVKLKGKKKHTKGSAHQTFTVTQLSKDYGACPANQNP